MFLGQAVLDVNKHLQKAFISGPFKYKVNLGSLQVDIRDQVSKNLFRMDDSELQDVTGRITFEIIPFSNVDSKCGILEEILKGSRKRWCVVLADRQLYLFSQFRDKHPKVTIPLSVQCGTQISWHDKEIIKVSTTNIQGSEQHYFFACRNPEHRSAWYNKMTGIYRHRSLATSKGGRLKKKVELVQKMMVRNRYN